MKKASLGAALFSDGTIDRNLALWGSAGLTIAALIAARHDGRWLYAWIVTVPVLVLALVDLAQPAHALRRNFPALARVRWFFEWLRPFLRAYIVEGEREGRPFSIEERGLVYARAKGEPDAQPFGTDLDVYSSEYEWLAHSLMPNPDAPTEMRIPVGSSQCAKPYSASRLNISAMSFGSLGANAIEALNLGARLAGCYHDTGEGAISPYHLKHGGDIVWEIGSG